jgi:hypothetical protein
VADKQRGISWADREPIPWDERYLLPTELGVSAALRTTAQRLLWAVGVPAGLMLLLAFGLVLLAALPLIILLFESGLIGQESPDESPEPEPASMYSDRAPSSHDGSTSRPEREVPDQSTGLYGTADSLPRAYSEPSVDYGLGPRSSGDKSDHA